MFSVSRGASLTPKILARQTKSIMVCYGIFWSRQLLFFTWRHEGLFGGQEQKHFSPLGTKLYFHVNSSSKKSTVLAPNMAAVLRGCNLWSPVLTIAPSIQRIFCFFFFHFTFHFTSWMKQQPVFSSVYYLRYPVAPCVKRDLMIRRLDGKENVRKKGLEGKTTTLHRYHTFLYIPLPLLQDYEQGSI